MTPMLQWRPGITGFSGTLNPQEKSRKIRPQAPREKIAGVARITGDRARPAVHIATFSSSMPIDSAIDLPAGATKADLEAEMNGHILEQAELIGLYQKS